MRIPDYHPPPTLERFMLDEAFLRSVFGPFGSAKSTCCVQEIVRRANEQLPSELDGIRRSKVLVVRNTYKELLATTWETFRMLYPPEIWGVFRKTNMQYDMSWRHPDGGLVQLQVLFRALDGDDASRSLLSLELTGAWVNEAREVNPLIITRLTGRLGRYPAPSDYPSDPKGKKRHRYLIMDSNPPLLGSWLYCMHEKRDPLNPSRRLQNKWSCYRQPSAMGPDAENLENLPDGYYEDMMSSGMAENEIRANVYGEYLQGSLGKAIHAWFRPDYHTADSELDPAEGNYPVVVGMDCGLSPAAVFTQKQQSGAVHVLDELVAHSMSAQQFLEEKLLPKIASRFYRQPVVVFLDPAAGHRSQVDSRTVLGVLKDAGLDAHLARGHNSLQERFRAVDVLLSGQVASAPMLLIDPRCTELLAGLQYGYRFREDTPNEPDKRSDDGKRYSHVCEALQYACLHVSSGRGSHGEWVVGRGRASPDVTPHEIWF